METLSSNILVLSKKGKVLGASICPGVDEITELIDDKIGGHIDPLLNERFLVFFPQRRMSISRHLALSMYPEIIRES